MLNVFTTTTYEEIQRATVDGDVDFDVLDRQLFEDIQDQLIHPENTDAAHNVLETAFTYGGDPAEMTNALITFMNSGSIDSAQALRVMLQDAVDDMTRDEIRKIARS